MSIYEALRVVRAHATVGIHLGTSSQPEILLDRTSIYTQSRTMLSKQIAVMVVEECRAEA
jgi:hypothetical protein